MKILSRLEKSREFWFLFITSVSFFLFRLPSLFEPNWYGDEGIYQVIGRGLNQGRLLYSGIWDNKPPLLYVIYQIFNGDQFWLRLASLVTGLLAIIAFFALARELFPKKHISLWISTAVFAFLFGIPLIEGNIANSENFMLAPIIFAAYLIFSANNEQKTPSYSLSFFFPGFFLGIAFLFKIVALFDFAALLCFIFIIHFGIKKILNIFSMLVPFSVGFFIPLLVSVLYFFARGSLSDFIHAALLQNVGYVGYANKLIIPQGYLILKTALLGAFVIFLFFKRVKIEKNVLFVIIWLMFSLFNAFFSQRPYTHYVLVALPSVCLLLGLIFYEKRGQKILTLVFIATLFLLIKNFLYFGKTILYYQNYISFLRDEKSINEYRSFFDKNTPADYKIADYLRTHLKDEDSFFLWGNNAQVYVLAHRLPPGRYTVAYHMTSSKESLAETAKALRKNVPKFVVISEKQPFPFSMLGYKQKMTIDSTSIYERTF